MSYLDDNLSTLSQVINQRLSRLTEAQKKSLLLKITKFVKKPVVDDYKLSVIANKMIAISADYDDYVSVSLFKLMPDSYTLKMLKELEEQLYQFIKSTIIGTDLDKQFTQVLIQETLKKHPSLDESKAKQKALGNWGWLLPHAFMHILVECVNEFINNTILEDKKTHRKGRIRIKKMK